MIILKPIVTAQTVRYIPTKDGIANRAVLINETTNELVDLNVTASNVSYFQEFTRVLNLKEGHFYALSLYVGANLIHRDKIFCTNQNTNTYTVNKDEYMENRENIIFYE